MAANRILLLALLVLVILDIFLNNYEPNKNNNTQCIQTNSGGRQEFVKTMNSFGDKKPPPVAQPHQSVTRTKQIRTKFS